jgi:hypothetical protein
MNHVAEDNVADVGRCKSRTLDTLAYDLGCKFGGRNVFERSAKLSYGGSYGAQYYNVSISHEAGSFHSLDL